MKNSSLLTTNKKAQDIYKILLCIFFLVLNLIGGTYIYITFNQITNQTTSPSQTIVSKLIIPPNISLFKKIQLDRDNRKEYSPNDSIPQYNLPNVFSN